MQLVEGREFDVAKRTIASTKLAPGDELIFVGSAGEMEQVVLQSAGGSFLRFLKQEVSTMKKTSIGVRGMRLAEGDHLEHAYLLGGHQEYTITFRDRPYVLNKVRLAKRDTKRGQTESLKLILAFPYGRCYDNCNMITDSIRVDFGPLFLRK